MAYKHCFEERFNVEFNQMEEGFEKDEQLNKFIGEKEELLKYNDDVVKKIFGDKLYHEFICFIQSKWDEMELKTEQALFNEIQQIYFRKDIIGEMRLLTEEQQVAISKYFSGVNSLDIVWNMIGDARKIFEKTFYRYNYIRLWSNAYFCFYENYFFNSIFLFNNSYFKSPILDYVTDYRLDLALSMQKEILYLIYNNSKITKKLRNIVRYNAEDEKYYLGEIKSGIVLKLKAGDKLQNIYTLDKRLSPEYQVRLQESKKLKRLLNKDKAKATAKGKSFSALKELVWEFRNDINYYEAYMVEYITGVFTAWKVYNVVYEILKLSLKFGERIEEEIYALAHNIGKIHNLEFRLYLLNVIEKDIQLIKKDGYVSLQEGISSVVNKVDNIATEFNTIYDKMYSAMLYAFKNEKYWEGLEWCKNSKNTNFEKLIKEIELLQNQKMYIQKQDVYANLLIKNNKSDEYKWYKNIRENLKSNYMWIFE